MTVEQLKALTVGTLVKMEYDGITEEGEIIRNDSQQTVIIWPESGVTQNIGFTKGWLQYIGDLEVSE